MLKRLVALLLAVCLLPACAAPGRGAHSGLAGTAQPASAFDLWPGEEDGPWSLFGGEPVLPGLPEQPSPVRTAEQQTYGSAGLVGWPSILVSVYLDEWNGQKWDDAAIAATRQRLALAVDWIRTQCAGYGAAPHIYYDDGTPDSGLFYHQTFDGRFAGGEESEESEAYYSFVEALCAELDTDALHERYGTSSIGFLFFLPVAGVSFTIVHYLENESDFYYEYSSLYRYDAYSGIGEEESPAVYAHEILHLYGAADLYEGSADQFVTPELTQYVSDTWPDAIMLDTYEPDGSMRYNAVNKTLCPLTAYRLGLLTRLPELKTWPDIAAMPPGTFADSAENARLYPFNSGAIAA